MLEGLRDRVRYSASGCWQQVALSPQEFLALMDEVEVNRKALDEALGLYKHLALRLASFKIMEERKRNDDALGRIARTYDGQ